MTTTQNLHLPQWEKTDRIMMDDFNEAFDKLDAMPRIATGTYTGDGTAERTIDLGFMPKALLLFCQNGCVGALSGNQYVYGGLVLPNLPIKSDTNDIIVSLTDSGFRVRVPNYSSRANLDGYLYYYLAIQ